MTEATEVNAKVTAAVQAALEQINKQLLADAKALTPRSSKAKTVAWPFGAVAQRAWDAQKAIVVGMDPRWQTGSRFYGIVLTGADAGSMYSFDARDWNLVPETDF